MPKIRKCNKLVRDNVVKAIEQNGEIAKYHIASNQEYINELKKKLYEEIEEFLEEFDIKELADVMEVIYSICSFEKINIEDIESKRIAKRDYAGGFLKRIILDEVITN